MTGTGRPRRRRRRRALAGVLPAGRGHGDAVAGRGLRPPRARVRRLRHPGPGLGDHGPGRGGRHAPRHLRPRRHRRGVAGHRRSALRRGRARPPSSTPSGTWRRARRGTRWRARAAAAVDAHGRTARPVGVDAAATLRPASRWWDRSLPSAAGIAVYNDRLLRAVDGGRRRRRRHAPCTRRLALPAGVGHFPVDTFGVDARPASYDAVVYTLGNSDGHLSTVETALRYPGWIWLHEVRLAGHRRDRPRVARRRRLRRARWRGCSTAPTRDGPRTTRALRAGRSVRDLVTAGVGLLPLLAERCRGLLVNSEVARQLVLLDLAPLAHHPPIHVLPPACPPVTATDRSATPRPIPWSWRSASCRWPSGPTSWWTRRPWPGADWPSSGRARRSWPRSSTTAPACAARSTASR